MRYKVAHYYLKIKQQFRVVTGTQVLHTTLFSHFIYLFLVLLSTQSGYQTCELYLYFKDYFRAPTIKRFRVNGLRDEQSYPAKG